MQDGMITGLPIIHGWRKPGVKAPYIVECMESQCPPKVLLTQNYNKHFLSIYKYCITYVSQYLSNPMNYLIIDKLGKTRDEIFRIEFILYQVIYNFPAHFAAQISNSWVSQCYRLANQSSRRDFIIRSAAIYFPHSNFCCNMAVATAESLVGKKVNYYRPTFPPYITHELQLVHM